MGVLEGTALEIREQIREFEDAEAQRIMLQWHDLDDFDGLSALADGILL
ncbi:MAG TPA: hypothetical protein VFI27_00185 [candidate division Zixibacteria bacterium]|nr:hypothetical protein [candidate division Zixibacteria bacterium]